MVSKLYVGATLAWARALAVSYITSGTDTTDATTYTFAGKSIGTASADRVVAVFIHGRGGTARTVSTVTIAGVSATIVTATNVSSQQPAAWAYALVPSGTTGDVVVTFSGSLSRAGIELYTITGGPITVVDSDTTATSSALTVDVATGGVTLMGASRGAGTGTVTWTGVTGDHSVTIESGSIMASGKTTNAAAGTLSVRANWGDDTNVRAGVVTFGPA